MPRDKKSTGSNFYIRDEKSGKTKRVKAGTKGVDVKGAVQTRRGVTPGGRDYEAVRNKRTTDYYGNNARKTSTVTVGHHTKFRDPTGHPNWGTKDKVIKIQ